jgi:hypothetical protein
VCGSDPYWASLAAMLKVIFERVDGLKQWAILIGVDESPARIRKEELKCARKHEKMMKHSKQED